MFIRPTCRPSSNSKRSSNGAAGHCCRSTSHAPPGGAAEDDVGDSRPAIPGSARCVAGAAAELPDAGQRSEFRRDKCPGDHPPFRSCLILRDRERARTEPSDDSALLQERLLVAGDPTKYLRLSIQFLNEIM